MFIRSKTANSSISVSPIKAALLPEISEIIRLWGNKPALVSREEQYVFPFLDGTETAQQVKTRIGTVLKKINKYLKVISDKLELGLPNITTYYSRHSYATRLKNAGVSLQNISESLGHSNLATTKYYLDSIEDDQVVKQAKLLL
jgi:integrase